MGIIGKEKQLIPATLSTPNELRKLRTKVVERREVYIKHENLLHCVPCFIYECLAESPRQAISRKPRNHQAEPSARGSYTRNAIGASSAFFRSMVLSLPAGRVYARLKIGRMRRVGSKIRILHLVGSHRAMITKFSNIESNMPKSIILDKLNRLVLTKSIFECNLIQ